MTYEAWLKLPKTKRALKIIFKDWNDFNSKQLKLKL